MCSECKHSYCSRIYDFQGTFKIRKKILPFYLLIFYLLCNFTKRSVSMILALGDFMEQITWSAITQEPSYAGICAVLRTLKSLRARCLLQPGIFFSCSYRICTKDLIKQALIKQAFGFWGSLLTLFSAVCIQLLKLILTLGLLLTKLVIFNLHV